MCVVGWVGGKYRHHFCFQEISCKTFSQDAKNTRFFSCLKDSQSAFFWRRRKKLIGTFFRKRGNFSLISRPLLFSKYFVHLPHPTTTLKKNIWKKKNGGGDGVPIVFIPCSVFFYLTFSPCLLGLFPFCTSTPEEGFYDSRKGSKVSLMGKRQTDRIGKNKNIFFFSLSVSQVWERPRGDKFGTKKTCKKIMDC